MQLNTSVKRHGHPVTYNHTLHSLANTAASTFLLGLFVLMLLLSATNYDRNQKFGAMEYTIPTIHDHDGVVYGSTGFWDTWDRSTVFKLWLYHAWVLHPVPAGIFISTNPSIQ